MKIVIDSREQKPYSFENIEGIGSITKMQLSTGDYSVCGFTDDIAIERKSLDDFVSTIIHDRKRFLQELQRAKDMFFFAVVIEASVEDIALHHYNSKALPVAVLAQIASFMVDYQNIPILFCGSRAGAQVMTAILLRYSSRQVSIRDWAEGST